MKTYGNFIVFFFVLIFAMPLFAHGTKFTMSVDGYNIHAMFEDGTPIKNGKVLIFKPGEVKPYKKIKTDENGFFNFIVKGKQKGLWIMQILDDTGHGLRINLPIDSNGFLSGSKKIEMGTSYIQKILMALAIVWGFVGTALYFKRR